jgi:hypothetical protein
MVDGGLERNPFSVRLISDGSVQISRRHRLVTTLGGKDAEKLRARLAAAATDEAIQELLARATGNYKRFNERGGKQRGG